MSLSVRVDLVQEALRLALDDLKANSADGERWAAESRREFLDEHQYEAIDALVILVSHLVNELAVELSTEPAAVIGDLMTALEPTDGSAWKHKRRAAEQTEDRP